jgi:succinyl-CoA synthetase beta subunit
VLGDVESLGVLESLGLPVAPMTPAADVDSAVAAAEAMGYPVVLKLDAPGLAHKSDAGGVRLSLVDAETVRAAALELLSAPLPDADGRRGITVQRHIPPGLELIAGVRRDPQFGPVVLVGFGGILAEALDDVAIRLAPVRLADVREMLSSLRAARLLAGFRGSPAVDLDAVADLVVHLAVAAVGRPDWLEVDLNPIIVGAEGPMIVDALIVQEKPDA